MKSLLRFSVAWVCLSVLVVIWYSSQNWGTGCDGGLCILQYLALAVGLAGAFVVALVVLLLWNAASPPSQRD